MHHLARLFFCALLIPLTACVGPDNRDDDDITVSAASAWSPPPANVKIALDFLYAKMTGLDADLDGLADAVEDGVGGGGAGLVDGDMGDIVVSGSGTVLTLDAGAVTTAKIGGGQVTAAKLADGDYGSFTLATGVATVDAGAIGATQLANTAVTPGSYGPVTLTVDAQGRLTAAATTSSAALQAALGSVYFPFTGGTLSGNLAVSGATPVLDVLSTGSTAGVLTLANTPGAYPTTVGELSFEEASDSITRVRLSGKAPTSTRGQLLVEIADNAGVLQSALTFDYDQSATFSGAVTASTFSGGGGGITSIDAGNIASGTVDTARLGSGVADGTTYLRGDQTWATVTAGIGGGTGGTDNLALRADGAGGATLQRSDLSIEDVATSTTNNLQLQNVHAGQTDSAFVLTPKGAGAFIVGPRPTASTTTGNARGANAIDLSSVRAAAAQVASGAQSVVGGGSRNTASGTNASVAGGYGNTASGTYGTVAGGSGNWAIGAYGTVAGGTANEARASYSTVAGGRANMVYVTSDYSVIGGGYGNIAWTTSDFCAILGGLDNYLDSCGAYCIIVGGNDNNMSGGAPVASIIGGGSLNDITATSNYSIIGGGYGNDITAAAAYLTISGGNNNDITGVSTSSTIAGGDAGLISSSGGYNVVGGGSAGTISGTAAYSTIPGGRANVVTTSYGTALGRDALSQWTGVVAMSAGKASVNGDRQLLHAMWSGVSTSATPVEMFLGGDGSSVLSIPSGSCASYDIMVTIARSDVHGDACTYRRVGRLKNIAGVTTLVEVAGSAVDDEDAGAAACSFAVTAVDAATDYLKLSFTGEAAKTYQLHATGSITYLDF